MTLRCRFILKRELKALSYLGEDGETYADALLSLGLVPDTVLIYRDGQIIPEDTPLEAGDVEIVTTCSRG